MRKVSWKLRTLTLCSIIFNAAMPAMRRVSWELQTLTLRRININAAIPAVRTLGISFSTCGHKQAA
eukprot:4774336-Karenia_brevis.AAC.1